MKKSLNINIDIEIIESFGDCDETIGRVFYPNKGNKIQIKKGLNSIEFSHAIYHEIGHLFDWYLSDGIQSNKEEVREKNAETIGESIRFRENSDL